MIPSRDLNPTKGDAMNPKTIAAAGAAAFAALIYAERPAAEPTHVERVIGRGQIRYGDAGPERWAMRFRHERRIVTTLRARLASRLDRIVYLVRAFECVHEREGSWTANTGNGYWGGLQFGWHEWQRYGGRYASRADLASPSQQMAAAITYQAVAGFYPWPNTARACGLIP